MLHFKSPQRLIGVAEPSVLWSLWITEFGAPASVITSWLQTASCSTAFDSSGSASGSVTGPIDLPYLFLGNSWSGTLFAGPIITRSPSPVVAEQLRADKPDMQNEPLGPSSGKL